MKTSRIAIIAIVAAAFGCEEAPRVETTLVHPRDMALPAPGFQRPDPEALRFRLANGTMAYIAEDTRVPLVTIAAVIGSGTIDGPIAGAAESLAAAWRAGGTVARPRAQVAATLRRMVGKLTVEVGAEETVVTLNVPREDFREAMALFADLLRRPRVLTADVATAAQQEASAGQYAGALPDAVEAFHDHLYNGHPQLGRAFGSTGRVTPRTALLYHQTFVTPGRVTLAVGGDVSRAAAEDALTRAFADWGPAEAVERGVARSIQTDTRRDVLLFPADKLQGWVVLGHELPPVPTEDAAALEVMNYILGGGHFDTRLFRATRDRRGLTNDDSGVLAPGIRAPGSYTFRTYGRPEVVPLLVHLTLQEIERIRTAPVNPEELRVAKGALADGDFTLAYRDGPTTVISLAREWNRYGDHDRSASYQERVWAVTAADVQSVAQSYLLPERIDVVIVGPMDQILNAPPLEDELPIRALGSTGGPGAGM